MATLLGEGFASEVPDLLAEDGSLGGEAGCLGCGAAGGTGAGVALSSIGGRLLDPAAALFGVDGEALALDVAAWLGTDAGDAGLGGSLSADELPLAD